MATREWHSKEPGIDVYHNNKKCGPGKIIKPRNKIPGKGGKLLCEQCRGLNQKRR